MIEVRPARNESEVAAALDLRHVVFCVEQGVTLAEERDGRDGEAQHLVAIEDGVVIGTCRLLVEDTTVKLGRMAVARSRRGLGLARALLREADARARALGAERIVLGAQLSAQAIYERAGYEPYGDVFVDAGIEHVMMDRSLA
jgi:predicted GNAT family N-acyltransferase